jgi:hypothetical protein
MSISANIGLLLAVTVGSFPNHHANRFVGWFLLLAKNDPHVKLMRVKELKFAGERFQR